MPANTERCFALFEIQTGKRRSSPPPSVLQDVHIFDLDRVNSYYICLFSYWWCGFGNCMFMNLSFLFLNDLSEEGNLVALFRNKFRERFILSCYNFMYKTLPIKSPSCTIILMITNEKAPSNNTNQIIFVSASCLKLLWRKRWKYFERTFFNGPVEYERPI